MGIESIGSTISQGYQDRAAVKPATENAADISADVSSRSGVNQAASTVQSSSAQQQFKETDEKRKTETTMKDVNEINKLINHNTVAEFGYNEPTNRITIKIKDKETDEVIKEIPSEKALEMLARAWELAGLLVDEKR